MLPLRPLRESITTDKQALVIDLKKRCEVITDSQVVTTLVCIGTYHVWMTFTILTMDIIILSQCIEALVFTIHMTFAILVADIIRLLQ